MTRPFRHLDLFSGIGGFALAVRWLGGTTVAFCEIEPYCQRVLRKHWPDVPIHGDVNTLLSECNWLTRPVSPWYPFVTEDTDMRVYGNHKLTDEDKATAVGLYDRGLSCGALADYYGVSRQSMWDVLRTRTTIRKRERFGRDNHFYRGGVRRVDRSTNLAERAIEKGLLVRADRCSRCGEPDHPNGGGASSIQAHHEDYTKPLDIVWLCHRCHYLRHEEIARSTPAGQEIDLLTAGVP